MKYESMRIRAAREAFRRKDSPCCSVNHANGIGHCWDCPESIGRAILQLEGDDDDMLQALDIQALAKAIVKEMMDMPIDTTVKYKHETL